MATWRQLIEEKLHITGDKIEDLDFAIEPGELDREFDDGFGSEQGAPFTAWSENYVYFPICYDGSEWVGVVYRNPNGKKMFHQGG